MTHPAPRHGQDGAGRQVGGRRSWGRARRAGTIVFDAWGTRSRAILSHAGTGMTASFSDHAMVTGHGRGFSGATPHR